MFNFILKDSTDLLSVCIFCLSTRFGQPPADIIKELAPELEFDKEGMPKMDMDMGMSGMPPFMGNDNCTLM